MSEQACLGYQVAVLEYNGVQNRYTQVTYCIPGIQQECRQLCPHYHILRLGHGMEADVPTMGDARELECVQTAVSAMLLGGAGGFHRCEEACCTPPHTRWP